MASNNTHIQIRISQEVHQMLKKYKEETGVSITFAIEKAVMEYLERNKTEK